jgi:hypothetical protein
MATAEQQDILDALAAAAVDLVALMPQTATLMRPTLTADLYGGATSTDVTVGDLPCRRRTLTGREVLTVAPLASSATYKVTVPAGSDVRRGDALLIDGGRFEVQWVPDATFSVQLGCYCAAVS